MTSEVEYHFEVENERDIPRVGHRKQVRLNGKAEVLWIREVHVAARKYEVGEVVFQGIVKLGEDLWA